MADERQEPPERPERSGRQERPEARARAPIDPHMLELLVCPVSRGKLEWHRNEDRQGDELLSRRARLAFPVRDGVPILVPDEARAVDEDEL